MSILIEYENGSLKTAALISERTAPSPSYQCADGKTFCVGDLYDLTFEDLSKMNWQANPIMLNDVLGTKCIAWADKDSCSFAVDLNGLDTFYYYHCGLRFILSDNFWDIVKRLEPTYDDLDIPQLHNHLITCSTTGKTFIKNLYTLGPSQIGTYDPRKNTLVVRKYQELRYSGKITDVGEAADRVDAILHDAMEKIREKCGDALFGIGLSGGMDSRLIPHYAKAHGLRLTSFNTCIPKPHKLLFAQSIIRARELAQIFDIPFRPVCWQADTLKEKLRLVTRNNPLDLGGCAFKYEIKDVPHYDIHLSGGSGEVIGGGLPPNLSQYSERELVDIFTQTFFPSFNTSFSSRAKRALAYLLGKQPRTNVSNRGMLMSQLLNDDDYSAAREEVAAFVTDGKKLGKSNVEIFEDYLINGFCSRARSGAYESAVATKRAFCIYTPFILRETLNWDANLLENRAVLMELIRRHVPEAADVKGETFYAAAKSKTSNVLSKALTLAEFLLRGNGTAVEQYIYRRRHVRKRFVDEMNKNRDSWFHRAMGISDTVITEKMVWYDNVRVATRIWQLKDTIDCLEHREYLSF